MGKRTYPSGHLPADVVPATNRATKGPENLVDRLENLGTTRTTPLSALQAANYVSYFDDGEFLAEALGVDAAFKALRDYRARQPDPVT